MLTRKGSAATNVSWENLEVGQVVEAMVTGTNKGGLELEVKSMRAFMPAGQVEILGRQVSVEKAREYIEGLNLKLVYLVSNPRTATAASAAAAKVGSPSGLRNRSTRTPRREQVSIAAATGGWADAGVCLRLVSEEE